jgi:HAD superfamily hydrolase (TIGR01662 family)
LRVTRSGEKYPRDPTDVEIVEGRREVLRRWYDEGYKLYFVSNQSGIAAGRVSPAVVEAAFEQTIRLLDLPVEDVLYCPHQAFPIACFCRKPMPGMAVALIERHALSLPDLVVVGDMKSDAELAAAIGARYIDAHAFFARAVGEVEGAATAP